MRTVWPRDTPPSISRHVHHRRGGGCEGRTRHTLSVAGERGNNRSALRCGLSGPMVDTCACEQWSARQSRACRWWKQQGQGQPLLAEVAGKVWGRGDV